MRTRTMRVGVIGCGEVATKIHMPCLLKIPEVELTSMCDLNQERSLRVAKKFGVPSSYASASQMLEEEWLDIVHICTPPESHLELALMALDAGCHVLIEKPFVFKVSEAD